MKVMSGCTQGNSVKSLTSLMITDLCCSSVNLEILNSLIMSSQNTQERKNRNFCRLLVTKGKKESLKTAQNTGAHLPPLKPLAEWLCHEPLPKGNLDILLPGCQTASRKSYILPRPFPPLPSTKGCCYVPLKTSRRGRSGLRKAQLQVMQEGRVAMEDDESNQLLRPSQRLVRSAWREAAKEDDTECGESSKSRVECSLNVSSNAGSDTTHNVQDWSSSICMKYSDTVALETLKQIALSNDKLLHIRFKQWPLSSRHCSQSELIGATFGSEGRKVMREEETNLDSPCLLSSRGKHFLKKLRKAVLPAQSEARKRLLINKLERVANFGSAAVGEKQKAETSIPEDSQNSLQEKPSTRSVQSQPSKRKKSSKKRSNLPLERVISSSSGVPWLSLEEQHLDVVRSRFFMLWFAELKNSTLTKFNTNGLSGYSMGGTDGDLSCRWKSTLKKMKRFVLQSSSTFSTYANYMEEIRRQQDQALWACQGVRRTINEDTAELNLILIKLGLPPITRCGQLFRQVSQNSLSSAGAFLT